MTTASTPPSGDSDLARRELATEPMTRDEALAMRASSIDEVPADVAIGTPRLREGSTPTVQ